MFTVTIAMPDMHVAAWKERVKKSKQEKYEKNRFYRYKSDKCSHTHIGQLNSLLTYEPTSVLMAENIIWDCENHLTLYSNLRCLGCCLLTARGRSVPWLNWRAYKIFTSREFKISADELRTGSGKVKHTLSLIQLLVARTSLVSPLSWSSLSGTWVVKFTNVLRLSVELMNRACTEHVDNNNNNQSIKLDKVSYINSLDYSF